MGGSGVEGEDVAALFDVGDGDGGVGEESAEVGDLDVEGEGVAITIVPPNMFQQYERSTVWPICWAKMVNISDWRAERCCTVPAYSKSVFTKCFISTICTLNGRKVVT